MEDAVEGTGVEGVEGGESLRSMIEVFDWSIVNGLMEMYNCIVVKIVHEVVPPSED